MSATLMVMLVSAGLVSTACSPPQPSRASLAAEPVLLPLPDEVELGRVSVLPRRSRVGVPGRDGAIERVVAVPMEPAAVADLVQQTHGERYRFQRVDLGGGVPVTVELRGSAPTGATVTVTASTASPVPLYGGLDQVMPVPPGLATSVVITVASPQ